MFKPHQQTRWKKVEPLAKSFLGNTLHLLGQLTDPDMSRFLMARLNASVPFFHAFERLTRKTLKSVLALFGSGEPALRRVQSILLIRNMAAVPCRRRWSARRRACTASSPPTPSSSTPSPSSTSCS